MQSAFWNIDDHKRNGNWESTFYVEKGITKPWDAFAQYAGDLSQGGGPKEIAHFGTAYRLPPGNKSTFTLDSVFRMPLSHFFAVGYSFRIDKLRR